MFDLGRNRPCQNLFTFDYYTIILQFNRVAASLFLLGFALDSAALTLGQVQGAALIGRPLNLSIPVSLGEGETGDGFCATVEITQGASRIDPGRVAVTVESDARSGGSRLRVRSSTVIDEPVVTVNLQAGCAMKSSRQYVLLSDMPAEPALPVATAPAVSANRASSSSGTGRRGGAVAADGNAGPSSASPSTFPAVSSDDADRARRRANAEAVLANAQRAASAPPAPAIAQDVLRETASRPSAPSRASVAAGAAATVPTAAPRTPPRVAASATPATSTPNASTAGRSRLQLDSAVPATAGSPALAASAASNAVRPATVPTPAVPPVVAAAPVQGAPSQAPAPSSAASAAAAPAAAVPPATAASAAVPEGAAIVAPAASSPAPAVASPTPEEAERALRLQVMEATLNALRAQTAENQRTLSDVRAELVASRESRYMNPVIYALIGLLLLALLAIAYLLRGSRRRAASAWWNDSVASEDDPQSPASGGAPSAATGARSRPAPLVPVAGLAALGVRNDAEVEETAVATPIAQRAHDDDADLAPARSVNTEELFDVQQQSDFFLSLGQHTQAIAVLSEHIAENPQTSALAYLDLLRIHHSLGNREAYGRVGQEFERVFNATLPSFDSFNDGGNGLEHYRSTLARITEQWPASETLAVIEELVFRRPGTDGNEAFDLAAYQELLLLYAVAKEVIDPDSAPPAPVTPISYLDTAAHGPTTAPSPLAGNSASTRPAAFMPYEMPTSPATPTVPAALAAAVATEVATAPAPLMAAPLIYGTPEDDADGDKGEETRPGDLEGPTARVPLFPDAPLLPDAKAPADDSSGDTISDLTRETTLDSNLIEFDLFDPEVEAKIAPKQTRY